MTRIECPSEAWDRYLAQEEAAQLEPYERLNELERRIDEIQAQIDRNEADLKRRLEALRTLAQFLEDGIHALTRRGP